VFGLFFGFILVFRRAPFQLGVGLAVGIGAGLVIGFLSAAYGDRFWYRFMDLFRWLFYPYP
jgi:hypothetical protein